MKHDEIYCLTKAWEGMTHTVLDLKKFSLLDMQNLLKDTYKTLITFHKDELVPKEISKLLLEMDNFLYFTSLMENKEVGIDFYNYQYICSIVAALKKGFFESDYSCDYPNLKIKNTNEDEYLIDFETDIFNKKTIKFHYK